MIEPYRPCLQTSKRKKALGLGFSFYEPLTDEFGFKKGGDQPACYFAEDCGIGLRFGLQSRSKVDCVTHDFEVVAKYKRSSVDANPVFGADTELTIDTIFKIDQSSYYFGGGSAGMQRRVFLRDRGAEHSEEAISQEIHDRSLMRTNSVCHNAENTSH
jgi:hypothetical protein